MLPPFPPEGTPLRPELASPGLSILIPVYNEEQFVGELLHRVASATLPPGMSREIIIVDDCSTDRSAEAVESFIASCAIPVRFLRHSRNRGKGAAIRTALASATGEWSVIQDADLEYDPSEYSRLIAPLLSGKADVVYGSRFLASGERRVLGFRHSLANRLLTAFCNAVSDLRLTDVETCYKIFPTSLAKSIPIRSDRFGIDPELTVKFARRGVRICETAIGYRARTYEEGKKIGLRDAFEALWVILHSRFTAELYNDSGSPAGGRFKR